MLRLTFLLCSGLFLVMLLGGRDFGQLRPGLARAPAVAEALPVTAEAPVVETASLAPDTEVTAPAAAVAETAPVVEPVLVPVAQVTSDVVEPAPARAPFFPEPAADVVALDQAALNEAGLDEAGAAAPDSTIFTLQDYIDPKPEVAPAAAAEQSTGGEIWYVAGNSLNVRAGPSTNDEVVGRLTRGEATLVVARKGDDWAQIRIEGDGIEGYVAMRFLSAEAPAFN